MAIKGVIFDSDGTLVDSEPVAARLLQRLLAERGIELDHRDVLQRFRGVQFAVFVGQLCEQYAQLDAEPFMHEFRARSLDAFRAGLEPMPGAVPFVQSLALDKCVASNGPVDKIHTCLGQVGLLESFAGRIVSAYEVQAWKPAPGLIVEAARVMGLPPAECVLVDDSHAGVEAGLAAGSQVIGYGTEDFSPYLGRANFHRAEDYPRVAQVVAKLAAAAN
ncbi:HAD-IA family hydrolase [Pseudomonas typographi]|uniref:HAD-IA family hydrolase n=1 Tax=Pseudomonas typographi TaxID=2715964 RepID=A0ABR7Z1B3_9PSED|nr:HAD-IA family hydrolase [Pseudomonas typographi]MBD1587021.1 HAD-IA family hydrolase [Pseudomonas typographi]MBD1599260.1 HAD-IA family hydrolase [Pseudomonas typographi]